MIYRELGQTGMHLSAIGLGTWAIGGAMWGGTNEDDALAAIRRALDEGINFIDTAPLFGFGQAETRIGRVLAEHDRAAVHIADKVGLTWRTTAGRQYMVVDGTPVYANLQPETIRAELEDSLRRLGAEYLDLYMINLPDRTTPVAETMGELQRLKQVGKIRAIGVSNVTLAQLQAYLAAGTVDFVQQRYNMLDRRLERDLLPFCRERGIAVIAYSTLAQGLLTGDMPVNRRFPPGDMRADDPHFSTMYIHRTQAMLDQFITLRQRYDLDQTQLTLAWAISRPGITCALAGARNELQAADIARGGDKLLTPEDLATMDRIIDDRSPGWAIPKAA